MSSDWSQCQTPSSGWSVFTPSSHYRSDDQAPNKMHRLRSVHLCPVSVLNSKIWVQFEFLSMLPGMGGLATKTPWQSNWFQSGWHRTVSIVVITSPLLTRNVFHLQAELWKKHAGWSLITQTGSLGVTQWRVYIWSDPHTRNFSHVLISLSNS